jgi:hypothetical protein
VRRLLNQVGVCFLRGVLENRPGSRIWRERFSLVDPERAQLSHDGEVVPLPGLLVNHPA